MLQPEAALADEPAAGRLVHVLPNWQAPPLPVHLMTAPGRLRPRKPRNFVELVVQRLGGGAGRHPATL